MAVTIQDLNTWPRVRFIGLLGGIFEHSLWVAERAEPGRPYADTGALHDAMVHEVEAASREEQLELLRAHPDLASVEPSADEVIAAAQAGQPATKGLTALSDAERARLSALNAQYREKFGFAFIIDAGARTRASIFSELERRLRNDADTERGEALGQVYAITRTRLEAIVSD